MCNEQHISGRLCTMRIFNRIIVWESPYTLYDYNNRKTSNTNTCNVFKPYYILKASPVLSFFDVIFNLFTSNSHHAFTVLFFLYSLSLSIHSTYVFDKSRFSLFSSKVYWDAFLLHTHLFYSILFYGRLIIADGQWFYMEEKNREGKMFEQKRMAGSGIFFCQPYVKRLRLTSLSQTLR